MLKTDIFFTYFFSSSSQFFPHVLGVNRHVPHVFSCLKSIPFRVPPFGCPDAIHGVKHDSKLGARGVEAVRVNDDLNDAKSGLFGGFIVSTDRVDAVFMMFFHRFDDVV